MSSHHAWDQRLRQCPPRQDAHQPFDMAGEATTLLSHPSPTASRCASSKWSTVGNSKRFRTVNVLEVICEHGKRRGVPYRCTTTEPPLGNKSADLRGGRLGPGPGFNTMRRPGQVWRRGGRNAPVACPHSQPKAGSAARRRPTAGRGTPGTSSLSESRAGEPSLPDDMCASPSRSRLGGSAVVRADTPWTRVAPLWSALKRFGPRDGPDPSLVKLSSPGVKTLPTLSARPPLSSSEMFMQRALRAGSGASQLEHSLAGERLVRCALLVNRWGAAASCWQ